MQETKSLMASKTFWFGFLQVLLGLYGLATGQMGTPESMTLITTGIGTIGFRTVTKTPISGI